MQRYSHEHHFSFHTCQHILSPRSSSLEFLFLQNHLSYVRETFKPVTPDIDDDTAPLTSIRAAVSSQPVMWGIKVENTGIVTFFFLPHNFFFLQWPLHDLAQAVFSFVYFPSAFTWNLSSLGRACPWIGTAHTTVISHFKALSTDSKPWQRSQKLEMWYKWDFCIASLDPRQHENFSYVRFRAGTVHAL